MQIYPTALPCTAARLVSLLGQSSRILMAAALVAGAPLLAIGIAHAKTPGSTYCFYKTCHRVKSLAETRAMVGKEHTLPASFYDDCKADRYNPCGLTSSGEKFHPNAPDNAASPIYPDGTKLLVWSPQSKQALVLRINNAGPYWGNRTLDVSRAAAEKLGFKSRGVANLKVRIIEAPTKAEATYRRGRTYAPVAGDIGLYQSASAAEAALTSMQMIASAALAPFNGGRLPASLVNDMLPPSTVAVAAVVPSRKLPADAVADASSLVAMRWPVVSEKVATSATAKLEKTAALEEAKRGETWSQRVNKGRARDQNAQPASVQRSKARATAEKSNSQRVVRSTASKSEGVRASTNGPAKRVAAVKSAPIKTAALKTAVKLPVKRDQPNDMSVFSRHNPDAPSLKVKQAAARPALMKTSSIKIAANKS